MSGNTAEPELPVLRVGIRVGVSYHEMTLRAPVVAIGRGEPQQPGVPRVDLAADDSVSRQHAEIRWTGKAYCIVDKGSTNGTWLNGQRLVPNEPRELKSGDRIAVGRLSLLTIQVAGTHGAGPASSV